MKAFCTLVMSVVIRVTRPGTLNLSMLEKEKVWMLVVDGLPQVCGEARRGAGGEFARQGAKDQAQEGHDNHENAVAVDHRQVALSPGPDR